MEAAEPGYLRYFFLERHVMGFATTTQVHGGRGWWYYLPVVAGGGLPWILGVPLATRGRLGARWTAGTRLLWIWLLADVVVLDDVALEVDVALRGTDCGKHRRVGDHAILQQGDLVAHDERAADNGLLQCNLLVEDVEVAGFALELRQHRCTALRRDRSARILEAGGLSCVARDEFIGIRQCGASGKRKQANGCQRGTLERMHQHRPILATEPETDAAAFSVG